MRDVSKVKWPIGIHKGDLIGTIPDQYLQWVIDEAKDIWATTRKLAVDELERRKLLGISIPREEAGKEGVELENLKVALVSYDENEIGDLKMEILEKVYPMIENIISTTITMCGEFAKKKCDEVGIVLEDKAGDLQKNIEHIYTKA